MVKALMVKALSLDLRIPVLKAGAEGRAIAPRRSGSASAPRVSRWRALGAGGRAAPPARRAGPAPGAHQGPGTLISGHANQEAR
jgi:hypothetical protein